MHAIVGSCEGILHAPIPIAYTRHASCSVNPRDPSIVRPVGEIWSGHTFGPTYHGFAAAGIKEIGIDKVEHFSLLPLE